jgi:hypothetical protein
MSKPCTLIYISLEGDVVTENVLEIEETDNFFIKGTPVQVEMDQPTDKLFEDEVGLFFVKRDCILEIRYDA